MLESTAVCHLSAVMGIGRSGSAAPVYTLQMVVRIFVLLVGTCTRPPSPSRFHARDVHFEAHGTSNSQIPGYPCKLSPIFFTDGDGGISNVGIATGEGAMISANHFTGGVVERPMSYYSGYVGAKDVV